MIGKKIIKRILSSKILKKTGFSLINYDLLKYTKHYLWIPHIKKVPFVNITYKEPKKITEEDISLCDRLIAAYHKANEPNNVGELWTKSIETYYGELISIMESRNAEKLAAALSSFFRKKFVYGLASGDLVEHSHSKIGAIIWSLKYQDNIIALAEYLGIVRAESTQQGQKAYGLKEGIDKVIAKAEDKIGISIDFPDVGAPYGVLANNSLIMMEQPEHIYVALRINEAIRNYLNKEGKKLKLLEIGAGFGGLAYWILKLQRLNISTYTIIDLPIINVLQGYFLSKALGDSTVSLYGETFRDDATIFVLPTFTITTMNGNDLDVLINQDSMPEMTDQIVENYLRFARENIKMFFSYNHEASGQVLVPEIVNRLGGFNLLSRNASWLRSGYVEEAYRTFSQ